MPMNMKPSLLSISLISAMIFGLPSCKEAKDDNKNQSSPNIVLIVADDLGYSDLSCYGSPLIETPNLDRLAAQGIRFTDGYAAAPLCSPTRASILTGLNPARLNMTEHIHGHPPALPSQRLIVPKVKQGLDTALVTMPEVLGGLGYHTAHIGKWHLGGGPSSPKFQGYDFTYAGSWAGLPGSFHYPFFGKGQYPELERDGTPGSYLSDVLTDKALEYIGDQKDSLFYLSLCFYAPHVPIQGKEEYALKYQAKADSLGLDLPEPEYAAMVQSIDENVGRIMDKLQELNLDNNTLIVFTSDNGGLDVEEVPAFAKFTPPTTNAPLQAGKGYIYEGGIREPFIFRWPGVIEKNQVSDEPISTNDLLNTFTSVGGGAYRTPDGEDLTPLLKGKKLPERKLFMHFPHYSPQRGLPGGTVREGDFKLIVWYESGVKELYNLKEDVGEKQNLAASMPEKVEELYQAFVSWKLEVGAIENIPNSGYTGE